MTLGKCLRRARKKSGKRQVDIATEVSVKQPTVNAWESGKCRPETSRAPAVAKAYGVDPMDVLFLPLAEKSRKRGAA